MTSTNRNRITLDMPVELQDKLLAIALDYDVSISQLATFLIRRGLDATTHDDLIEARVPSKSHRFEFLLKAPRPFVPNVAPKRVKTA